MNKKFIPALAVAAFVLAACFNDEISTSIIWKQTNPYGGISSYVEKTTTTKFVDDDPAKGVDQVVEEYFHYPLGFGSEVRVVVNPCDGGFCDDWGTLVAKSVDDDSSQAATKLYKKNDGARRKTGGRGIAKTTYEDEPGVDGGGGH